MENHNRSVERPIKAKIPMKQIIIDSKGQMFEYYFPNGKIKYNFLCVIFLNNEIKN